MSSRTSMASESERLFRRKYVWQWPVRVFHWLNAAAVTVLFLTGLYIAMPFLGPAGEASDNFVMAKVRQIHFTAAFIFMVNFVWRMYWFWMGNNYARSGFPFFWRRSWWRDLFRQAWDYLRLDRGHVHLGHNALGGLAYTLGVIGLGWAQILTGMSLYAESDPAGFWGRTLGWLPPLLGGYHATHMWHHLFAWGFVAFTIIHIYIVFYDGQQYRNGLVSSMISGYKFYDEDEEDDHDSWLS